MKSLPLTYVGEGEAQSLKNVSETVIFSRFAFANFGRKHPQTKQLP